MTYYDYLYNFVYYSYLLPIVLVAGLLCTKRYSRNMNFLVLLCLSSITSEYLSRFLSDREVNYVFIKHVGQCLDIVILIGIFFTNIINKRVKFFSFVLMDVFLLFCIIYSFQVTFLQEPVISSLAIGIIVICLVLYYFFEVFWFEHIEDLSTNPVFWIKSMYLLYFSGTFAYNAMIDHFDNSSFIYNVVSVNWILLILCNLVFTLAIWLGRAQRT